MEFRVRPAVAADAPAAAEVVKSVYDEYGFTWDPDDYHADLYDLAGYYLARGHSFAVAESNQGILGTVALELFPTLPGRLGELITFEGVVRVANSDCALNRLYVHPECRRGGVGRALTDYVVELAKGQNRRVMEIWSDKRFLAAHALYFGFGAKAVGERICDDPDVSPEFGLYLPLG